jgi:hypothetical protein
MFYIHIPNTPTGNGDICRDTPPRLENVDFENACDNEAIFKHRIKETCYYVD